MKKIILITGGERSGKSMYAEQTALKLSDHPVYMATARIWDEEFRQRVNIHKARRGPQWTNIEEEKHLSRHDMTGRTVLIDCITLWATNFFFDSQPATESHPGETIETRQAQAGHPPGGTHTASHQGRVRALHRTGCHIHLRHQRNRDGRRGRPTTCSEDSPTFWAGPTSSWPHRPTKSI